MQHNITNCPYMRFSCLSHQQATKIQISLTYQDPDLNPNRLTLWKCSLFYLNKVSRRQQKHEIRGEILETCKFGFDGYNIRQNRYCTFQSLRRLSRLVWFVPFAKACFLSTWTIVFYIRWLHAKFCLMQQINKMSMTSCVAKIKVLLSIFSWNLNK